MDPLNLILLIIVVLIGWRLRSVLGTRNDDEKPGQRADAYRLNRDAYENPPEQAKPSNLGQAIAGADDAAPDGRRMRGQMVGWTVVWMKRRGNGRGLAFFNDIDPNFDEAGFLDGAARAYEMILTAFANDDLTDVRGFLGDEVAAGFEAAIAARQAAGQKLETRILRLDRPALDDAEVEGDKVRLDVRLRAEIISASYAADGLLDEDNLPPPTTSIDIWSFEGAHNSATPNWQLVATRAD